MTLIITASVAVVCAFAFGYALGYSVGKADGYAEHEDWCRMRRHRDCGGRSE